MDGLSGEPGVAGEVVDGCVVGAGGGSEPGGDGRIGVGQAGQARDEQALGQAGEERCRADAGGGGLVAEAAGDAVDEPVDAEPPQVVS